MCKRYGRDNYLDLRSEVILIILELNEDKKKMIIENGYLLPYALQVTRFQVSDKNWTNFRKLFGNRENHVFVEDFKDIADINTSEHLDPQNIVTKIKSDTLSKSNPYFYHSRLLDELLTNHKSVTDLSKAIGIPYRSVCYAIKEYRTYLKQWSKSAL